MKTRWWGEKRIYAECHVTGNRVTRPKRKGILGKSLGKTRPLEEKFMGA